MRVLKNAEINSFDVGFFGLGYESRAPYSLLSSSKHFDKKYVFGYNSYTEEFSYPKNKKVFQENECLIHEGDDNSTIESFKRIIEDITVRVDVFVDITVMSRHRLATLILMLLRGLTQGSSITISYTPSKYIKPDQETSPIRLVGDITMDLGNYLGDLSLPTSLILGLGYEKDKALGVCNYLDVHNTFLFIPVSDEERFEKSVRTNNNILIQSLQPEKTFTYKVESPYTTYLDLKSLLLSLIDNSRPLLVALGPKILSAVSVIIGHELHPRVPVWRVSSEHHEKPKDRPSSGKIIDFTVSI
jgi:hypothetical protein